MHMGDVPILDHQTHLIIIIMAVAMLVARNSIVQQVLTPPPPIPWALTPRVAIAWMATPCLPLTVSLKDNGTIRRFLHVYNYLPSTSHIQNIMTLCSCLSGMSSCPGPPAGHNGHSLSASHGKSWRNIRLAAFSRLQSDWKFLACHTEQHSASCSACSILPMTLYYLCNRTCTWGMFPSRTTRHIWS